MSEPVTEVRLVPAELDLMAQHERDVIKAALHLADLEVALVRARAQYQRATDVVAQTTTHILTMRGVTTNHERWELCMEDGTMLLRLRGAP